MTAPAAAPPGFMSARKRDTDTPPSKVEFGPDFTQTGDGEPKPKIPKVNEKNPPKPSPLGNLGANKKLRSPVRKLTDEDKPRVESLYSVLAGVVRMFKPVAAEAIEYQAPLCVDAWWQLAENNDNVRRALLAVIEGGDWGKVFMAHIPIVVAVLPESLVVSIMRGSLGALFQGSPGEPQPEPNTYPADQNGHMTP